MSLLIAMHKQWLSSASILLAIFGFVLMNVGFWASNADKDPSYRKRIAPNYDVFISSTHSLQDGTKVTKLDPMFWIYDILLKNEDSDLEIEEIRKLNCGGVSLSSDGKTHSHCIF